MKQAKAHIEKCHTFQQVNALNQKTEGHAEALQLLFPLVPTINKIECHKIVWSHAVDQKLMQF